MKSVEGLMDINAMGGSMINVMGGGMTSVMRGAMTNVTGGNTVIDIMTVDVTKTVWQQVESNN